MPKKIFTVTIPTLGYEIYELPANDQQDAITKLNMPSSTR
jgi:hypothetical protein